MCAGVDESVHLCKNGWVREWNSDWGLGDEKGCQPSAVSRSFQAQVWCVGRLDEKVGPLTSVDTQEASGDPGHFLQEDMDAFRISLLYSFLPNHAVACTACAGS